MIRSGEIDICSLQVVPRMWQKKANNKILIMHIYVAQLSQYLIIFLASVTFSSYGNLVNSMTTSNVNEAHDMRYWRIVIQFIKSTEMCTYLLMSFYKKLTSITTILKVFLFQYLNSKIMFVKVTQTRDIGILTDNSWEWNV